MPRFDHWGTSPCRERKRKNQQLAGHEREEELRGSFWQFVSLWPDAKQKNLARCWRDWVALDLDAFELASVHALAEEHVASIEEEKFVTTCYGWLHAEMYNDEANVIIRPREIPF